MKVTKHRRDVVELFCHQCTFHRLDALSEEYVICNDSNRQVLGLGCPTKFLIIDIAMKHGIYTVCYTRILSENCTQSNCQTDKARDAKKHAVCHRTDLISPPFCIPATSAPVEYLKWTYTTTTQCQHFTLGIENNYRYVAQMKHPCWVRTSGNQQHLPIKYLNCAGMVLDTWMIYTFAVLNLTKK